MPPFNSTTCMSAKAFQRLNARKEKQKHNLKTQRQQQQQQSESLSSRSQAAEETTTLQYKSRGDATRNAPNGSLLLKNKNQNNDTKGARQHQKYDPNEQLPAEATQEEITAFLARKKIKKGHTYTFEDLPLHMKDNPFIQNHYRLWMTTEESLKSVFEIHNETGNIWTHLIGFAIFSILGTWTLCFFLPNSSSNSGGGGATWVHYLLFGGLTVGCLGCMLFSALFHMMANHFSISTFERFHSLDYLGISCIIIGSFIPGCYYVFVCQPMLQWGYILMMSVLGLAGIVAPLMPCFEEPSFYWPRLAIYASIGSSTVIPCIHTYAATPINHTTQSLYAGVFLTLLLYAVGVVAYATKFPERYAPGRFDLILSSHQLWHTCVLMGAVSHYFTCVGLYQNWSVMQGRC